MNTLDLINKVAQKNDLTSSRAEMILDIVIERIKEMIKTGSPVSVQGFGTFNIVQNPDASSYGYLNRPSSQRLYISFVPDKRFLDVVNS